VYDRIKHLSYTHAGGRAAALPIHGWRSAGTAGRSRFTARLRGFLLSGLFAVALTSAGRKRITAHWRDLEQLARDAHRWRPD
jgi:hypothetical protein